MGKGRILIVVWDAQMDVMTADNSSGAVTMGGDCAPPRQLPLLEKVATAYAAARSAASEAAAAGQKSPFRAPLSHLSAGVPKIGDTSSVLGPFKYLNGCESGFIG